MDFNSLNALVTVATFWFILDIVGKGAKLFLGVRTYYKGMQTLKNIEAAQGEIRRLFDEKDSK